MGIYIVDVSLFNWMVVQVQGDPVHRPGKLINKQAIKRTLPCLANTQPTRPISRPNEMGRPKLMALFIIS